jgi:hypothetical protein
VPHVGPIREREEQTLTLIFGSVYHVINSICIYLMVKVLNIYIYRRGEYTRNPLEKYNNRKANTYLILNSFTILLPFLHLLLTL